jgi:maltooligosyltrehalose trehalohydrolase
VNWRAGEPLRVWAPNAGKVEAVLDGAASPMHRAAGGWWQTPVGLGAGVDYAFSVDGGDPLPDPRSRWQPRGVHGASRTLDPSVFRWTDAGWQPGPLSSAVVYELHVGTFSAAGTFDGAIDRLDHLLDLGVTHVQLMPVAEFAGRRGWGYDGVDLFAPHGAYGGPEGMARLVDACHGRGLAVLLDVVYNHLGPAGNYLRLFGPYFTDRYSTPWGEAVNLDGPGSDEVRRFFIDNALAWLRDYHIDGLRIDAVHAIFDASAVHFLEQLATEVEQLSATLGRHLVLIAESDLNDPRVIRERSAGGYGIDAQWSDDFHHALHTVLTGERDGYYADFGGLGDVARTLQRAWRYAGDYSPFRDRRHGREPVGLSGHRFLGYLQNHDQVGNRAMGERSGALMNEGRLMAGAAVVLCSPFVPMLFQGEEWAAGTPFLYFTDHDEELGRLVREGRQEEFASFGWDAASVPDPQAVETFERSRVDWSEASQGRHARLLDWHRRLIALRRSRPELSNGRLDQVEVAFDDPAGWLWFRRGAIAVALNLSESQRAVPLSRAAADVLLASHDAVVTVDGSVSLPPDSVAVLELE